MAVVELSPQDYYAYAEANGLPAPTNARERARLTPYVVDWKKNALERQKEDRGHNALGLGLGLLGAGGLAAFGLSQLNKGAAKEAAAAPVAPPDGDGPPPGPPPAPYRPNIPAGKRVTRATGFAPPRMKGTGNSLSSVGAGSYRVDPLLGHPEIGPRLAAVTTPQEGNELLKWASGRFPGHTVSQLTDAIEMRLGTDKTVVLERGTPVPEGLPAGTPVQWVRYSESGDFLPDGEVEVVLPGKTKTTIPAGPEAWIARQKIMEETVKPDPTAREGEEGSIVAVGKKGNASSQPGFNPHPYNYMMVDVPRLVTVMDVQGRPTLVTAENLNDPFIRKQVDAVARGVTEKHLRDIRPSLSKIMGFDVTPEEAFSTLVDPSYADSKAVRDLFMGLYTDPTKSGQKYLVVDNPQLAINSYKSRDRGQVFDFVPESSLAPGWKRQIIEQRFGPVRESALADLMYEVFPEGAAGLSEEEAFSRLVPPFLRDKVGEVEEFGVKSSFGRVYQDLAQRNQVFSEDDPDKIGGTSSAVGGSSRYEPSWLMAEPGVGTGGVQLSAEHQRNLERFTRGKKRLLELVDAGEARMGLPAEVAAFAGLSPEEFASLEKAIDASQSSPPPIGSQVRRQRDPLSRNPEGQVFPGSSTPDTVRALAMAGMPNIGEQHHLLMASLDPVSEAIALDAVSRDPVKARELDVATRRLMGQGLQPQEAQAKALHSLVPSFVTRDLSSEIPGLAEFVAQKIGYSGSAANLLGLTTEAVAAAAADYPAVMQWAAERYPELAAKARPGNEGAFTFEQFVKPYVRSYALGRKIAEESGTGGSAAMFNVPQALGERLALRSLQEGRPLEDVISEALLPRSDFGRGPLPANEVDRLRSANPAAFVSSPFEAALAIDRLTGGAVGRPGKEPYTNAALLVERFAMEAPPDGSTMLGALKQQLGRTNVDEKGRPGLSSYPIALRFSAPETASKDVAQSNELIDFAMTAPITERMDADIAADESFAPEELRRRSEFEFTFRETFPQHKNRATNALIRQEYDALARRIKDTRRAVSQGQISKEEGAAIDAEDSLRMNSLLKEQASLLDPEQEVAVKQWLAASNLASFGPDGESRPGSTGLSITSVGNKVIVAPDAFRHRGSPEAVVDRGGAAEGDWDSGEALANTIGDSTSFDDAFDDLKAPLRGVAEPKKAEEISDDALDAAVSLASGRRRWDAARAKVARLGKAPTQVAKPRSALPWMGGSVNLDSMPRSPLPDVPTQQPLTIRIAGQQVDPSRIFYRFQREMHEDYNLSAQPPVSARPSTAPTVSFGREAVMAREAAASERARAATYALRNEQKKRGEPLSPLPELIRADEGGYRDVVSVRMPNLPPEMLSATGDISLKRGNVDLGGSTAVADELRRRGLSTSWDASTAYPGVGMIPRRFPR